MKKSPRRLKPLPTAKVRWKSAPASQPTDGKIGFPIVGIGASAGGLEALELFLKNAPSDSGMAFVIVQHLDPTHKGIMAELLQRATAMKVLQVKDRTKVQPDHVYVIPPNKDMSLLHGVLHLLDPVAPRGLRLPIDFFFRSLADDAEERSIGVILSGMGTDGTLGLKAIKGKAGVVFVQDPGTAKFDGMPRSAIEAGLADVVASAEALPGKISSYLRHLPLIATAGLAQEDQGHSAFEKIVILLRAQTGHDFSLYKKNTVYRRIERRMGIHQIDRIGSYVRFLRENPQEAELLFKELLIGVTSFFRDPATWEQLRTEVLPALLKDRAPSQALLNLRAAVEQSANMIVITDIRGNIEYVNPSFEKATGYSAAEAAGKNPSMLKSGEQGAKFYRHLWTTIRSGKIWQGEFHNRRKDGSLYWEMATISPVQNDKGETVRYLAIKEDITEQKQAQDEILRINRQLAEATAKAERATAAKSEFLATMTHELRNPLTGVLGFAEILAGTALDDEQQSLTEGIRESGIHLLDLINDILDFSSIEKGVLSIHAAPFALAPLVKLSSELIRKSAADKGLAFHCDVAAGVPEQITGDERRIRQILINLLANAVKFTSDGSVRLRVTRSGQGAPPATQGTVGILPASENQIDRASQKCRVECLAQGTQTLRAGSPRSFPDLPVSGGSFLDFSVEDTGLGISSEALARLFQLFTQADATISRKYGGTGIGLAVSQRLAEAMGGTISVVSAPGKGSTFTFHFPLEAPAGGAVPSRLLIGADGASPSSPSAATPIRPDDLPVLVVEDERTNALVVGKMLQILGYRAEFAANGVEAVEAFAPGKYLAIFMDLRMPVMNGFEAAGIIRSRESGSRVPIILLSANVMPGSRETYLAAGMDDFLSKPFKRAELAAKLANVSQR